MATSEYAEQFLNAYRAQGFSSISWHITLSEPTQRALTSSTFGSSLFRDSGQFFERDEATSTLIESSEPTKLALFNELESQLALIHRSQIFVSHISSHHHLHVIPAVAQALVAVLSSHQKHPVIIRGYGDYLGESTSKAHAILLRFAKSATLFYEAHGFQTTRTIGFRTMMTPSLETLREELQIELQNDRALELMMHIASYSNGETPLNLNREQEFFLLQECDQMLVDFECHRMPI